MKVKHDDQFYSVEKPELAQRRKLQNVGEFAYIPNFNNRILKSQMEITVEFQFEWR